MSNLLDLPRSSERSTGLDLLRTALALWVLFAHAVRWGEHNPHGVGRYFTLAEDWLERIFQTAGETHPAVLAFIVLSGYCIHRNGLRRSHTSIVAYAIRRTARIYPVYVIATIVGVAAFTISFGIAPLLAPVLSGTQSISVGCIIAKLTGAAAFVPLPGFNFCAFQGNAPLRTVGAEIWLYIAYPVLLLWVARLSGVLLWAVITCVWFAGVSVMTINPLLANWWHNDSMFGFLAYWWIGVAGLDDRFTKHFRRGYFLPLVVAWIAATVLLMQGAVSTPLLVEVRKLLFALLVAGGLGLLDQVRAGARATEMFGRAGYSIYAFHAPVVYTLIIAGAPWWAACAAAVCVGLLMFFTVEKPFERLGRKVAYGRAVLTAPGRTSGLLQMSDRRSAASRSAEAATPPA